MIVQRVEKHIIKKNNKYYNLLDDFCFRSKNLYNHANYIVRNEFIKNDTWLRYNDLDKILKQDKIYTDYKNMPTAQIAQQTLRLLDKNWKSFFSNIKDWSKNKSKYNGKPNLPKYLKKNNRYNLILTNQECKLKNGIIYFPKCFKGFTVNTVCYKRNDFVNFNQIRIIPRNKLLILEVIYSIEISDIKKKDNSRYCSIDIGIDNLVAVTNNIKLQPFIINGKGLKSINKYYNKKVSHYKKISKRMNNLYNTNKINNITIKRNNKINDYMHKASRYIINYCIQNNINTIIIGNNKGWKQNSNMSKKVNQSFVGIPTQQFIRMVQYKAETVGINVILHEESYTSGTSFLDNEQPIKSNYNKARRIHRGLFVSNNGTRINADVNASFQIMKKVFPNVFSNGIEGVALHPFRVNLV